MYTVYILYSQNHNQFYTGFTNHLERRLQEHNSGRTKSNKAYRPWRVVYSETCEDRIQARIRERYWKSGIGREERIKFI